MARWNFCSKAALAFGLMIGALNAHATQIQALYTAACQRHVGIILDVGPREIKLLTLEGRVMTLRRFEVIYYATFLVDTVPITEVRDPGAVPMIEFKTLEGNNLVRLVKGWPVNFSKDKIAILNERGTEILIDRSRIWELDYDRSLTPFRFNHSASTHYAFAHPYAFSSCPLDGGNAKGVFTVFPQQLLNDPVSIKRELDRFAEGHAEVRQYDVDQDFYARPEVYENETQLGLWLMAGARYGASHDRANNFTPYLVNDFSAGPFGFQSEFKTGSGPIYQTLHEETQTQIYYRLKADYFHFTAMVDPNLLLVGSKYTWQRTELSDGDVRANESAFIELGFDYGRFSLEVYPAGVLNMAGKVGQNFRQSDPTLVRGGLRWQGYHWMINVLGGAGSKSAQGTFSSSLIRANFEWSPHPAQRYEFSLLQRSLNVNSNDDQTGAAFSVDGDAVTGAAYGHFRFKRRYWAGAMLALERLSVNSSGAGNDPDTTVYWYPKVGALMSLSF